MKTMKKLFGIVMLMMLSISVSAEEQSKVTVDIGEFKGGTITENLEKSQKKNEADGTYEIVITVKPDEGFIITKNDIVVMATIPAKTRTEGNGPELAEKLTLTGDEPDDPSKERDYSVTVKEGFGIWVKEANFHTSSLVIKSDATEIEEGKLAGVTTITIQNEEQVVSLGNNDVTGKTVIVPGNLYNEYKTTDGWNKATITVDEKESTKMEGVSFTGNNDYTAFFSKEPLKVPSVLHAYMITGLDNEGKLVLTEVGKIIPSGTAVLLYSEKIDDNDFRTVVSKEEGQAVGGKNPLQVVTEGAGKEVKVGEVYMLYNDVFYYTQAGTIPQNGIYLDPNVLNDNGQYRSRARLLIGGTGNTTGISDVITNDKARTNSEVWYTLDGRQLNGTPGQKGIYIRNGKKMVVTK